MPQPLPDNSIPATVKQTWLDHPAVKALQERFADVEFHPRDTVIRGCAIGMVTVTVPPAKLLEVMRFLWDDPAARFDMLAELTCVDYLTYPDPQPGRFGVTYGLLSTGLNHRLWVKVFLGPDLPQVASVTSLWRGADWLEREVFDMFGVVFTNHPDLRRILTAPGMKHYPLRKDYPITGLGERENLPVIGRSEELTN